MLVRHYWLWSLLFAATASAYGSSSSSPRHTSTTKKSVVSNSSSLHTTSTTKKSVSTSSSHPISTTKRTTSSTKSSSPLSITSIKKSATSIKSTKTSSASSTPTLPTFYLVAKDTGLTAYDGVYLYEDPNADFPGYPFMFLDPANKNTVGAATFNLFANGTLQYNGASGAQFASVSDGHPQEQPVSFGYTDQLDRFGLDPLTCKIAAGAVTCASAQTGANTFFFDGADGGSAALEIYEEVEFNPVTLKVMPV